MSKPLALIVEDQPDIGDIFSHALREAGFQIELIDSGSKAVAWLATQEPDIIVLDIRLPHVSGVDILRQIRTDPRLAETFVIVATAYPESADLLHEQADVVLIKPISFSQLRDLAKRLHPRGE